MATVRIKLRNSSVPGRAGSVYYQITHRQKSVQITTGYKLLPAEWDGVRQCVAPVLLTGGDYYLRKVQRAIDSDLSVLKNAIGALERAAGHYTAHDVAQAFRESHSGETFFGFMERQIEQLLAHGRLGTARNYRRTRQSFSQFLHGEDLSFAGCTAELVADYEQWLKRRGVTRNTVSFYMRILRSVYNKAVGEGIASQRAPFEKVYTGVDKTRKRAVDMATIESLRKLDLRGSRSLAYARDLFVFSFYMRGMAFVDMAYLRKSDVRDQTAQYIRRKTGQSLCIRLEPCITEIIRRYARKTKNSPYVFPIIAATDENEAYAQYQNALSYYNKLLKKTVETAAGGHSSFVLRFAPHLGDDGPQLRHSAVGDQRRTGAPFAGDDPDLPGLVGGLRHRRGEPQNHFQPEPAGENEQPIKPAPRPKDGTGPGFAHSGPFPGFSFRFFIKIQSLVRSH